MTPPGGNLPPGLEAALAQAPSPGKHEHWEHVPGGQMSPSETLCFHFSFFVFYHFPLNRLNSQSSTDIIQGATVTLMSLHQTVQEIIARNLHWQWLRRQMCILRIVSHVFMRNPLSSMVTPLFLWSAYPFGNLFSLWTFTSYGCLVLLPLAQVYHG